MACIFWDSSSNALNDSRNCLAFDPGVALCSVFGADSFPDQRLFKRAKAVARRYAEQFRDRGGGNRRRRRAERRGASRLFHNERIDTAVLRERGRAMMSADLEQTTGDLVVMHDSSEFDLHGRDEPGDAGPLRSNHACGYMLHTATVIDPRERMVLGTPSWKTWTRSWRLKRNDQSRPAHKKESYKWKQGLMDLRSLPESVQRRLVHVMDREGDVHENFEYAREQQLRAIVGVRSDHRIACSEKKLRAYMQSKPVMDRRIERIESSHTGVEADVTLTLRFARVTVLPAKKVESHRDRKPVVLDVVFVRGQTNKQQWLLLTTCAVESIADAWRVFDWYRLRTIGEDAYKMLKTGLLLEHEAIDCIEAFERKVAILIPVANLLHRWTRLARVKPNTPAEPHLDGETLSLLAEASRLNGIAVPRRAWTISDVVRRVAELGGYEPREGREPGWLTLWRGWRALQQFVEVYRFARSAKGRN